VISDVPLTDDESCAATTANKLYGDLGALRCLASGYADVAFINAYNLSNILRMYQNIKLTDNRVIDFFNISHHPVCHKKNTMMDSVQKVNNCTNIPSRNFYILFSDNL
jgi:hypothetical protein